jgi:hypothetical protein
MVEVKATSSDNMVRFCVAHERSLTVEEIDVATAIECGFTQEHIAAEGADGTKLKMDSGAGCGSKWVQVIIEKPDEKPRYFRMDMAAVLTDIAMMANETERVISNDGRAD